ncbi:DNA polymerase III subunit gamma/tau [Microvenator marinus]|uniref:DNA polymerase III subunit gamma/tau n=1 Tax=Microvenator marinus TaxID=2600177 RepID=A0A5B8XW26_9DELT|nr:DNA polymerase III subunit gamma/tau [Microvenator marinus]QED28303.1 DNA polymerase III subunit gamma/tau [Microvenator marinus]
MSYVVLARKWRPKQFDEVVGQEHVARTLKNAIVQNRVAHAFLFTGARGVGKTSSARILAKALNCQAQDGPTPTPCDQCDSCKEITAGQSVDVFEIDGASNRGINEIRELRESVRYAPSRGRTKIYIIDEVHMLTTEAFNALLKTLEEPPSHVKFVFATTEPQKIPVTILSRCQRYDFKRIGQNDIVRHLELLCGAEGIKADKVALQIIARQAAGGMRDALSLLDQIISFSGNEISEASVQEILGVANRTHLFDLSQAILNRDAERCLLTLDEVHRFGYDMQQFAAEFVQHLRDFMVLSVVKDAERVTSMTSSEIAEAHRQIEGVSTELLHRYFALAAATVPDMARSQFPKMHFELMLVRMASLEPLISMDLLVDRLAALESEFDEPEKKKNDLEAPPASSPRTGRIEESSRPAGPSHVRLVQDSPAEPESPEEQIHDSEPELVEESEDSEPIDEPEPSSPPNEPESVSEPELPEVSEPTEVQPTPAEQVREPEPELVEESEVPEPAEVQPTRTEPAFTAPAAPVVPAATGIKLPKLGDVTEADDALIFQEAPEVNHEAIAAIERLNPAQIAGLTSYQRWTKVVDAIRPFNQPVAAACEYGYPERFADHVVELSFPDKYSELITEPKRYQTLEGVVHALFGPEWKLDLQQNEGSGNVKSIAEEREAEKQRRKKALVEEVTTNPIVSKAKELFEVEEDRVRVQVQLFEDM